MVAFIQKAHGCIFFYDAIKAQAAQLAISNRQCNERTARGGKNQLAQQDDERVAQ